ncbi:hypothetical protein ACRDU6_30145 [Mycolicibacterium sp. ELW1]|uniref:hypothetical protein n=1 Tax=Mycobacteriaceae TaxID=1762 RepID=UPI0011EC32E9|nr:hypothetical protein [Mycobacterium sp. ELW1]QEN16386.1 hypothetical protein D3H54_26670 [Mycobacterium sp. ELW1]
MGIGLINRWSQRICVWSGVLFAALFFVGFGLIARYIPPPDPARSAIDVASFYRDHANAIRAGMILSMYGLVFFVPFTAAISVQLKRIEGQHTPLSYAQLGIGCTLPVAFFPALYYFQVAAYRPERSAEAVQTLNDMGWLPFTGIVYAIFVQNLVIGIAVLSDRRGSPVFPRWYGYFCLWTALLYCPASLDVFFQAGPLAWNGLFSWWLSLVAFFAWIVVTVVITLQAITRQHLSDQAQTEPTDSPASVGGEPSLA